MADFEPSYYAVIPADVRYCKDVEDGAKLLYGEISSLANKKGYCWASNEYFASLYGKSEKTIQRWISGLKKCGFIVVTEERKQAGTERKIYLAMAAPGFPAPDKNVQSAPDKNVLSHRTKMSSSTGQKCPPNNKYINTTDINNNQDSSGDELQTKPKKKSAPRKTRLPDDFTLTTDRSNRALEHWAAKGRYDLSANEEFENFRNHHTQHGKTMADWDAAWRTWYSNAVKFNRPPQQQQFLSASEKRSAAMSSTTDYSKALDF